MGKVIFIFFILNSLIINSTSIEIDLENKNDFQIQFSSIKCVEDNLDSSIIFRTKFKLINNLENDKVVMHYTCENNVVKGSFNLLFLDSNSSKIYFINSPNIYDINPTRGLNGVKIENTEYSF